MSKQWKRHHWIVVCVVLMLITTACFRDSGESVGSQPVSQLLPSDTPIPTNTPEPPTETATPTPTEEPEETDDADVVNIGNTIPGGTRVAQLPTDTPGFEQPDDFALTATALIGQLTQDASIILTTQAFEAGIGQETPTPLATATTDPLFAEPTQQQQLVPGADCVHQIRAGENLYQLSLAYGVSVADMASRSAISNWNLVLVGQRITIPGCGTTGFRPPATSTPVPTATVVVASASTTGTGTTVTSTDPLVASAQSELVASAQNAIQSAANTNLVATRQYTVQQYDTLFGIAQSFGTTVDAIAALNGITNINTITMGDVLAIP